MRGGLTGGNDHFGGDACGIALSTLSTSTSARKCACLGSGGRADESDGAQNSSGDVKRNGGGLANADAGQRLLWHLNGDIRGVHQTPDICLAETNSPSSRSSV
jgi:hypothetical protein